MKNYYQIHSTVYPSKRVRWLVTASILSIVYFLISIVALHLLDTSVRPLTQGLSYFAVGPYEHLMAAAFIILGLGGMALTAGLYLALPSNARSMTGLILLGLWSVTTILAGIFPLDAEGAPQTTSGMIHNLAGMNFLCIAVAALLISRRLKLDHRWNSAGQIATRMAWAVISASVLLFILMGPLHPLEVGGIAQRVYWATVLIWLLFVATRLREIVANQYSPIGV